MLGLKTMPKDDLGTSPADLVFGSPLTVPGEFVGHGQGEPVPELLCRLRDNVADLRPVPPVHHASPTTSSPTSLFSAKFVFIRHNGHKSPLQPPMMAHFVYWPQGTNSSRFRSVIVRRPFLLTDKRSHMLTSLLRSKWHSHHDVVALHTLPHSPLFCHLKSNQVPQS